MKDTRFHFGKGWRGSLVMQGVVLVVLACHIGRADEGMWLFNAVPEEQLSRDMAFVPSRAWLDHIQRSSPPATRDQRFHQALEHPSSKANRALA